MLFHSRLFSMPNAKWVLNIPKAYMKFLIKCWIIMGLHLARNSWLIQMLGNYMITLANNSCKSQTQFIQKAG